MPQDCYIDIAGIKTRYWQAGENGTPLVLLHGIRDSVRAFVKNIDVLAEHHRVYAFDMVGFGLTDKPAGRYHVDDMATFARDFMDKFDLERPHLLGHSMGGGVALRFASMFPQRLNKLILAAPAGFGQGLTIAYRLSTLPVIGELLTYPIMALTRMSAGATMYDGSGVTEEMIQRSFAEQCLPGAQQATLSALRTHVNLRGIKRDFLNLMQTESSGFSTPTLIMWGEQDKTIPFDQAQRAVSMVQGAQLHTFERCGHQPQWEHADEFNQLVIDFLKSA